jgi:hypothetical protein
MWRDAQGSLVRPSKLRGRSAAACGRSWQIGEGAERIPAEFLEQQRRKLGPMLYSQEYECEFVDAASSAFASELIEMALVDDFEPFLAAA